MGTEKINVDLNLSNDLISLIEDLDSRKSLNDNIKILIAVALFSTSSVSLDRAAEIAEMDVLDFIILLKNNNISWKEYIEDELYFNQIALKDFGDKLEEKGND